jgi:hypothetical protein
MGQDPIRNGLEIALEILYLPSRTPSGRRGAMWLSHHCHDYITTTGTAFVPLLVTTSDSRPCKEQAPSLSTAQHDFAGGPRF